MQLVWTPSVTIRLISAVLSVISVPVVTLDRYRHCISAWVSSYY